MVRYRCSLCGNLTRFDVTMWSRTRSFHHYTIGGDLDVEHVEVLEERTEDVSCRWCGHGRSVEIHHADADGEPATLAPGDAPPPASP